MLHWGLPETDCCALELAEHWNASMVAKTENIVYGTEQRGAGGLAQLVECSLSMREVRGSNPLASTSLLSFSSLLLVFCR